jgi:hypothetical protein
MLLQTQAGQVVNQDGTYPNVRSGRFGDTIVSELNGRYYEQAFRGNVFFSATQAAITFAANGLTSSSAVGLVVYNPASSTKNLVPLQGEVLFTSLVTSGASDLVGVISPYSAAVPSYTGTLSAYSAKGGAVGGSVATVATTLTFAANPILWKALFSVYLTTTVTGSPSLVSGVFDLGGSVLIPPGQGLGLISNIASTGLVSITWAEIQAS